MVTPSTPAPRWRAAPLLLWFNRSHAAPNKRFRPSGVAVPVDSAAAAVVRPCEQGFLLHGSFSHSAPPSCVGHPVLLLPFAFRQVLLARLLPARLRRARYYVGSDSSSSPDLRLFRSPAHSVRVQAGPGPGTVWQLKRRLPPPAIAITGSRLPVWVEREDEVSLNLLQVFPTAPPRITSGFSVP